MIIKQKLLRFIPNKIRYAYFEFKKKFRDAKLHQLYFGNEVKCVICGSEYSSFIPHRQRQNVKCLNCDSFDRDRLLYMYLKKIHFFDQKIKLLHFAPEKPFFKLFSENKNFEYLPVDIEPSLYSYGENTKILKVDITNIPYKDETFDVIICNHVLEHVADDALAMKELYRVMKKNGWGILQVPIDYSMEQTYEDFSIINPKEREVHFGQHDHVRIYGKDYVERLGEIGFNVNEDLFITSFSVSDILKYGLNKEELIYQVKK